MVHKGVALGGFMGTGKSTVGARLAERLGMPFVDVDAELAARFGPVRDQIEREGEPAFRARERAVVAELCDGVPRVVATGGGAWVDADNRARLAPCYLRVVLHARLDTLAARLGGDVAHRPLWARAAELYAARAAAYADADVRIDTDDRDVDAVVDAVEAAWRAR